MNRIVLIALLVCSVSATAEFSDNFSDGGANNNWLKNPAALAMSFESGVCTITNTDTMYSAYGYHTFTTPRSTFTLGGKITLSNPATGSAGFICCLASSGMPTGYYVSIERNERVAVDKVGSTGVGSNLVAQRCPYLTSGTNELQISKKGNKFNVLCNGKFVATFTDGDFDAGNIAMQVATRTTAVFDDLSMTDDFIDVSPPTCFTDDFDDGDLLGWASFGSQGVKVENHNKSMQIATEKSEHIYEVIDLPLDEFVLRATFSHRGGSINSLYGLFVCGQTAGTIPVAGFGINGGRYFAAFNAEQTVQLAQSTKVKGAAYIAPADTTWYIDTLEVVRRKDAAECLFIVNGDTLSRFNGLTFNVTGAGIFCTDSLKILADNFLVAQGEDAICPVRMVTHKATASRILYANGGGTIREFDLLGRSVASVNLQRAVSGRGVSVLRNNRNSSLQLRVR